MSILKSVSSTCLSLDPPGFHQCVFYSKGFSPLLVVYLLSTTLFIHDIIMHIHESCFLCENFKFSKLKILNFNWYMKALQIVFTPFLDCLCSLLYKALHHNQQHAYMFYEVSCLQGILNGKSGDILFLCQLQFKIFRITNEI